MNKKKFKEEYDTTAVFNNLTSLLRDEQIINKQKVLLYLKYKTYSELLTKEKEKNKRLEEENKKLNEKKIQKQEEVENKENLNNLNINVDLNQLEFYAHKNDENGVYEHKNGNQDYAHKNGSQDYAHDNPLYDQTQHDLINSLLEQKDNKIIELENKVIKLQIIRRLENTKSPLNQPVDLDNSELINLKSKLEFIKMESERDKKNLNSKLKEFMIKYEETKSKYDSCYSQLKNSLINLEEIRKFHMSRDVIKIKRMTNLNKEMKGMEYVIKDLENQIYGIQREYMNLCEYIKMNLERDVKRKEGGSKVGVNSKVDGKVGGSKVGDNIDLPTTPTINNIPIPPSDSFYENEISNLLQVCDSLTEQNNLLEGQRDDLQSQIDFLKRRNLSLEKDFEMIRLKDSSSFEYIQTYLIKINELSDSIQEICKKLENSNLERNKLTKLNIERISLIEKYKEDLRNKEIEFNILKNNYNEILEDLKNKKNEEDKKGDTPLILCNLCECKPKNVALISCMHTFCDECIESRIKFRNRRCPTCGLVFGSNDVKKIYL